ncbi:MAG: universal stress protein [Bacteroidales bacterium]|nr:universal stress protein [Bacteroidales bacterium]
MKTIQNVILIPTDFSEVCNNAVEQGMVLAKALESQVWLLHVFNKDTQKYLDENKLKESDIERMLKETADKYSEQNGISVKTIIKNGNLFEEIKKTNDNIQAKLIILGTHGKAGFQKITGSYVLKVVTSTNTPTIVVQKKSNSSGYENIIFPITASTKDRQKVSWAINIAKLFDATVHLIPKFESEKYQKTKIMTVTKQIKTILLKYNIKFVDKVSSPGAGNFAKQVIDYAVVNNGDLIMTLVNKGKTLFFTSWDEEIIYNSSQIPVICINPVDTKKSSIAGAWY